MKNHGNQGNQGNQPGKGQSVQGQENALYQPPAIVPEAKPKETFLVTSIDDLIAQMGKAGGTLSPECKVELEKMRTAQETLEAPKRLGEAEAEVAVELPKLLEGIASKHKTTFAGRKCIIVFRSAPKEGEANPMVSFGPEVEVIASGKKRSNGNGDGKGFKSHGAVILHKEAGKEIPFSSFGAMAKELGWKMEGRANATVAITNPTTQTEWEAMNSEQRKNLPTLYRVEPIESDGKTVQHVYPVNAS
jgi:hypothetical protein